MLATQAPVWRAVLAISLLATVFPIGCAQNRKRAIRHLNAGVEMYQRGRHAEAVAELEKALKEDDGVSEVHQTLGMIYLEMDQCDKALPHLTRVTTQQPDNAPAQYSAGVCYQKLDRPDQAKAAYAATLKLNPQMDKAHYRLGTLAHAADEPKQADAAYRKAIELNPRFDRPFVKLAVLYLEHEYPELAMQVLRAGAKLHGDKAEIHKFLGTAHHQLKEYDKAIAGFEKALQLNPGGYDALYNLGLSYAAADKRKAAEDALTRFTRVAAGKKSIDPELVRAAHDKIAEIHGLGGGGMAPPPTKLQ